MSDMTNFESCSSVSPKRQFRKDIVLFEEELKKLPGAFVGDAFPLTHVFADGLYIRQITMPANTLIVSKIHAKTHPFFVLKGKTSIVTENGLQVIEAPYSGITKAGTKRILWNHTEVVFTTVHKTDKTDLQEIENEIIAKDFEEFDEAQQEVVIEREEQ